MELQETHLDQPTTEVLDQLVNESYMTPLAYLVLSLYGDRTWLHATIASQERVDILPGILGLLPPSVTTEMQSRRLLTIPRKCRETLGYELSLMAHEQARSLSRVDRLLLTQSCLIGDAHEIDSLAETYAQWAYDDSTIGGCLLPFRKRVMVTPFRKVQRRLGSPSFIKRYVRQREECSSISTRRLLANLVKSEEWPDAGAVIDAPLRRLVYAYFEDQPVRRDAVRYDDEDRKILRRAVKTACDVVGRDRVRQFIDGKSVTVYGTSYDFLVSRGSRNLLSNTQNNLLLVDKQGEKVARLCLYFEDTPIIDQLTAIALHVQAGEELELVRTANLIQLFKPDDHGLMEAKRQFRLVAREGGEQEHAVATLTEEQRAASQAYVEATRPLWADRIGIQIYGRDYGRLRAYASRHSRRPVIPQLEVA